MFILLCLFYKIWAYGLFLIHKQKAVKKNLTALAIHAPCHQHTRTVT